MKQNVNSLGQYYLSGWMPPSLAPLRAFIAAITEVIVARLAVLSAGREPELNICRYANEHMLAAFFWLFKPLRGFVRTSHVSKRLFQSLRDHRTAPAVLRKPRSFTQSPDSPPPWTPLPLQSSLYRYLYIKHFLRVCQVFIKLYYWILLCTRGKKLNSLKNE